MEDARYNLQVHLDKAIQDNMKTSKSGLTVNNRKSPECSKVHSFELELHNLIFRQVAFATHVDAYLDAGLGELDASDLYAIGTMPNVEEWASWITWEQAFESVVSLRTILSLRGWASRWASHGMS